MRVLLNFTRKQFWDEKIKEKYRYDRYVEASKTKKFLDELNYWET